MSRETGVLTTRHPSWLDVTVPPEYEDEELFAIILFFVIHSPCKGRSARGIPLEQYGWKVKPWYSPKYLKEPLDRIIFGEGIKLLKAVDSKGELKVILSDFDLNDNFHNHISEQRAAFVLVKDANCENEYMSLFCHIRNALAHGRLGMYSITGNDIAFVMEDGRNYGSDGDDQFEVTARIVIYKSTLLKIINLLMSPPGIKNYREDIICVIKNGMNTKKKIMEELEIDESTWKSEIQKLKADHIVEYSKNKWTVVGE